MARCGSVVILAAGQGKRMQSALPKVLHPLCGRPMLAWVLDQAQALEPERVVVVVGSGAEAVRAAVAAHPLGARAQCVLQEPQLGTGHALQVALRDAPGGLARDPGLTVVLCGDMPCLRGGSLVRLLEAQAAGAAGGTAQSGMALLTALVDDPRGFGRVVRDEHDGVLRIVEERDASEEEREIPEINLAVYAFDGAVLVRALAGLANDNAQGEYYLTDAVAGFRGEGRPVAAVELEDPDEALGVNSLAQLAEARWVLQARILEAHLANGVAIEDPATTYVEHGVEIGAGTRILPCTVIRAGVRIGRGCEVGPFAHLRAGSVLEDGAEVGNFVELKATRLGEHAKAKHLSYLGDGDVGARANIGAGTIFANYDGRAKHRTVVGERTFVGSGTVIVAPNELGAGSTTGAGAVVTRDSGVGAGEVWVGVPARRLRAGGGPVDPASDPAGGAGGAKGGKR
jgi:bifunctional UDP-N-acetylglucosamine pyrophosphorylase/glucosamine-1-phosphate N-acetyltransferase